MSWLSKWKRTPEHTAEQRERDARVRAQAFWARWGEVMPEITAALSDSQPQRADYLLAELVSLVHPELDISLERGRTAIYALVLSRQANPELRVFTDAWLAEAPKADQTWEFHDAVPPVPDPHGVTVNLGQRSFPLSEVRVSPQRDPETGLVDVAVYHPGFAELDTESQARLTFLPLDATLGEKLAEDWLGRVETAELEPQNAITLPDLRSYVESLRDEKRGEL